MISFWYFYLRPPALPLSLLPKLILLFLRPINLLSSPIMINRPHVAGAVLQTTPSLIKTLTNSSFVKISSKHPHLETLRVRDLNFLENVHLPPSVMCHVSHVMCHMSGVACHIHFFLLLFSDKMLELVGGGSVINGAYPI